MTFSDTFLSMTQVTSPLTAAEVAKRLGVTRQTVNDWARAGVIPAITLPSGRKRYRVADVEAIENGHPDDQGEWARGQHVIETSASGDDLEQKIAAAAEAKERLDRALK